MIANRALAVLITHLVSRILTKISDENFAINPIPNTKNPEPRLATQLGNNNTVAPMYAVHARDTAALLASYSTMRHILTNT